MCEYGGWRGGAAWYLKKKIFYIAINSFVYSIVIYSALLKQQHINIFADYNNKASRGLPINTSHTTATTLSLIRSSTESLSLFTKTRDHRPIR